MYNLPRCNAVPEGYDCPICQGNQGTTNCFICGGGGEYYPETIDCCPTCCGCRFSMRDNQTIVRCSTCDGSGIDPSSVFWNGMNNQVD